MAATSAITLFEKVDYKGDPHRFTSNEKDLIGKFNGKIMSVQITGEPRENWSLYQRINYADLAVTLDKGIAFYPNPTDMGVDTTGITVMSVKKANSCGGCGHSPCCCGK